MIVPMRIKKKKKKNLETAQEQRVQEQMVEAVKEEPVQTQEVEEVIIEEIIVEQPEEEVETVEEIVVVEQPKPIVKEEVKPQPKVVVKVAEAPQPKPVQKPVATAKPQPTVAVKQPVKKEVKPIAVAKPQTVLRPVQKPQTQKVTGKVELGKTMMFTLKISGANPVVQENYDRINNAVLSYKDTERYYEGNFVEYKKNDKVFARLVINGSALKLYLDLAHSVADEKIFFHKETDEVQGLRIFVNIKSDKAGKNAVDLIDIMANKKHFEKNEKYKAINSVAELKELNKR